jgi:DnaK suppressor protein
MDKSFIKEQKEKLEEIKEKLETQLKSFAKQDENLKDNWKSNFPKLDKAAIGDSNLEVAQDEVEEYLNRLSVEHTLEIKLQNVRIALESVDNNQYGKCEKCKKTIPIERLKVCPEARLCLECERK